MNPVLQIWNQQITHKSNYGHILYKAIIAYRNMQYIDAMHYSDKVLKAFSPSSSEFSMGQIIIKCSQIKNWIFDFKQINPGLHFIDVLSDLNNIENIGCLQDLTIEVLTFLFESDIIYAISDAFLNVPLGAYLRRHDSKEIKTYALMYQQKGLIPKGVKI